MAKIDLSNPSGRERLRNHNREVAKGGYGKESDIDVRETIESDFSDFGMKLQRIRKGLAKNSKTGASLRPVDMSLNRALEVQYGIKDVNQLLDIFDHSPKVDTLAEIGMTFGVDNLTVSSFNKMLVDHSEFSNPMTTREIDSSYRFIIPEIFTSAVRTGYEHAALHNNWIASTVNMKTRKLTMPQILRGDGMPSIVAEGGNIPMGSLAFGRKDVSIQKIGTGFRLTDEMIIESSLDMSSIFFGEVGNDMAIGADSLGYLVLVNGEQADLSESAAVVGVLVTANGFTYPDIKKVFTRMTRLRKPATRLITGEDDAIAITGIDRFEGFNGGTSLASIRSIVGVPEKFENDVYVPTANQIMYLNPAKAMVKLSFRGMMVEKDRNVQNQTEAMFISDHIGFAILARDARVIQDKSVTIGASPFPSWMDIDTRIRESYKTL